MRRISIFNKFLLMVAVMLLTACSTANYKFEFDAINDSPGITILDYQFGKADMIGTFVEASNDMPRKVPQGVGVGISGPVGEFLYVKWRIDATGEERSDRVDLKPLLPWYMNYKTVYFVVQNDGLHIYLIDRTQERPANSPKYSFDYFNKVTEIYPKK